MSFFRLILVFIFFIAGLCLNAQDADELTANANKKKILIGEPLELKIKASLHPTSTLKLIRIDSIPHFEILENPLIDSHSYNKEHIYEMTYKITSFDSGHWVIPSFALSKTVKTDTIGIDVVFSEFNPEQEYHDIKDIIEVKPNAKGQWWWYAAGGALLLGLLLVYLLKKKKPAPVEKPQTVVDPYDDAMEQLAQLQKNKPDSKQFHTRLAGIFRLYIFRKKGILSLQKTTDDLIVQLKGLKINKDQYDKLSQSLRLGDFVKFAKYNPSDEDNNNCYHDILNSIKTIELSGS